MKAYKIVVDFPAKQDLLDIRRYITNTLKEPVIAKRIYTSIKAAILTLASTPMRQSIVREEPYTSLGVRVLSVENYTVFYIVDEPIKQVNVFRVLYNRRSWKNLL